MEAAQALSAVDIQLNEAAAAVDAGNGAEALQIYQSLAARDNATAECNLAADNGNAMAQYNLGMMYNQGRGGSQDTARAPTLFNSAAMLGNASAPTNFV